MDYVFQQPKDPKKKFKTIVGISDHTLGISVPIASVVLGAKIIEKHFIIDRKIASPDAVFSLEPKDLNKMVVATREIEKALGSVSYKLTENMKISRRFARSLFVVEDINAGEKFTEKNIKSIRPGDGLSPKYLYRIIGERARKDIKKGTPLNWKLITKSNSTKSKSKK